MVSAVAAIVGIHLNCSAAPYRQYKSAKRTRIRPIMQSNLHSIRNKCQKIIAQRAEKMCSIYTYSSAWAFFHMLSLFMAADLWPLHNWLRRGPRCISQSTRRAHIKLCISHYMRHRTPNKPTLASRFAFQPTSNRAM
jgi:hypothetical protein